MFDVGIPKFVDTHKSILNINISYNGLPARLLTNDYQERQALRIRQSPANKNRYFLSAMLCNKNNIRVRYFVKAWYGDDEVCNVRDEVNVDAGSWLLMGAVDLSDSLDVVREEDEVLRIFLNIVVTHETTREDASDEDSNQDKGVVERKDRRLEIFSKWLVFATASLILQHCSGD